MSALDADAVAVLLDRVRPELLIGGRWRPAAGGETFAVVDPADGTTIASAAEAEPEDARSALDAAAEAQQAWAATTPRERAELLRSAFDAVVALREAFAALITLEMGKPLAEARAEVGYGADFLRWFSEEAVRADGRFAHAPGGGGRIVTTRAAVGPCLLVTPWNFPLAMVTRKVGPAVAAGCTAVLKPAAQTPLTALAFAAVLRDAGLPDGVLNVVTTTRARTVFMPLLRDRRVRKLSFTGSTAVGRLLLEEAAPRVLRSSLELGGNAPFVVCADADLDAAVEGALLAKLRNGGQSCTAANRFLVARELAEPFAERLAGRMAALRLGHGLDPATDVGPLIDRSAVERVAALTRDARARGARTLTGCSGSGPDGAWHAPTVLVDVPADARLLHEEIFGPVAPIVACAGERELVAAANATDHGLAAYVYTRDLDRALRLFERIESGMVGLNQGIVSNAAAPFGGIGQSGLGREGGHEGLAEYQETRYLAWAVR